MPELLFFFSALGAFNGVVMSAYLFFFTRKRSLAKYLLAGLIMSLSIRIGKSAFLHFDPALPKIYLQVGLTACLFIGPFLFFYLKSVIHDQLKLSQSAKWTLGILLVSVLGVGVIRPYHVFPDLWNRYILYIIYWLWLGWIVSSGYLLRTRLVKTWQKGPELDTGDRWLLTIYVANLLIFLSYFMVAYGLPAAYYLTGPLVFSFFLYLVVFGYFYTGESEFSSQKPLKRYAAKSISLSEAQVTIDRLEKLMLDDQLYTNSKLKLQDLSDRLAIPKHKLSQILNDNMDKSFATYVNEYRIKEACQLLQTAHHLSLEGIGYEVGFHSKSTFYTTFKKAMGVTPSQYMKKAGEKI